MTVPPRLRKFVLLSHIVSSVGWLGAVAGFLAIAVTGVISGDIQTVHGAYLVMKVMALYVLIPLSIASLLTGLIQSLGSAWGLFRHYWVLAKLLINMLATIVLLLYMQTLDYMATVAAQATLSTDDLATLRIPTAIIHSTGALVLLLIAALLSVYKPRGRTAYGRRKQLEQRRAVAA